MPDDTRNHQVTLGCGTLILIALIVLFFSRSGAADLEREVRALRSEVGDLKKAIDSQSEQLKRMHDRMGKGGP